MAKGTGSDQTDFQKMLRWLDADSEKAAVIYESIRLRLIKIFYARGCPTADELADLTIDRVIKKIDDIKDNYEGNPNLYFYGVAKFILLENTRKPKTTNNLPFNLTEQTSDFEENELRDVCLQRCLKKLPEDESVFIVKYYEGEKAEKIKNRQNMCQKLKISSNNLRLKAYRIRDKLQECVFNCLN